MNSACLSVCRPRLPSSPSVTDSRNQKSDVGKRSEDRSSQKSLDGARLTGSSLLVLSHYLVNVLMGSLRVLSRIGSSHTFGSHSTKNPGSAYFCANYTTVVVLPSVCQWLILSRAVIRPNRARLPPRGLHRYSFLHDVIPQLFRRVHRYVGVISTCVMQSSVLLRT